MAELVHLDRALARRILGGDEAAFRDLFDRFFPRLYRFALARVPRDPEAARDIVQQTFCQRDRAAGHVPWRGGAVHVVLPDLPQRGRRPLPAATAAARSRVVLLEDQPDARAILESFAAPETDEPETGAMRSAGAPPRRGDRSTPCRAATAKRSSGNTSTGCRCSEIAGRLTLGREGGRIAADARARIVPRRDRRDHLRSIMEIEKETDHRRIADPEAPAGASSRREDAYRQVYAAAPASVPRRRLRRRRGRVWLLSAGAAADARASPSTLMMRWTPPGRAAGRARDVSSAWSGGVEVATGRWLAAARRARGSACARA